MHHHGGAVYACWPACMCALTWLGLAFLASRKGVGWVGVLGAGSTIRRLAYFHSCCLGLQEELTSITWSFKFKHTMGGGMAPCCPCSFESRAAGGRSVCSLVILRSACWRESGARIPAATSNKFLFRAPAGPFWASLLGTYQLFRWFHEDYTMTGPRWVALTHASAVWFRLV